LRKLFYFAFKYLFWLFFKVYCRMELHYAEKVPVKGGVVVASNHASYLDPLILGAALGRQATFMAREDLFAIPLIGTFVKAFSFPIKRGSPLPSTIKEAAQRLRRGEVIALFPEGGRSADGSFLNAKRGVGLIAAMGCSVVVPVYIDGSHKAFPVGAKYIKPAKVRVFFGDPIERLTGEADRDFQEKVTGYIMNAIGRCKELLGGCENR
jgi:1-acyl-sn-glycerol-3-phosphate acyltransferase